MDNGGTPLNERFSRLCSNVIGCPIEKVHIDMAVETVFEDSGDGITLPKFKPV